MEEDIIIIYVPECSFMYLTYSLQLISNKFYDLSYCTVYNFTALCTYSLTALGPWREGEGPETFHAHKITYGPLIDTALYVMCLMGANPLQGPLEGLGHESQDFLGPETAWGKWVLFGPKKGE